MSITPCLRGESLGAGRISASNTSEEEDVRILFIGSELFLEWLRLF